MTDFLWPEWPAPSNVRAAMTTRACGSLGTDAVAPDLRRLRDALRLPGEPFWLKQVHGTRVAELPMSTDLEADASFSAQAGVVCVARSADCLPVLFCDDSGSVVAAAHAGWRGLAAGVLEATVRALPVQPQKLMAWMGAAIGPAAFEVGTEVRDAFVGADPAAASAFEAHAPEKYRADIFSLARLRLRAAGVSRVYGGGLCTYCDATRFFSHRRDRSTGRMAALIWQD